jgi:hypothetical protein
MRRTTLLLATSLLPAMLLAHAAAAGTNAPARASVYGVVQHLQWQEFSTEAGRLLEETGPLFGIGASLDIPFIRGTHLECAGDILFGVIDYDGQRQDGVPVKTDTEYAWVRGEANLTLPVPTSRGPTVKPFAGAGAQFWNRNLKDTDNSSGYEENWGTFHAQIGMGAAAAVRPGLMVFGSAAIRLPLWNTVSYDFSRWGGSSDVQVRPGRNPAPA